MYCTYLFAYANGVLDNAQKIFSIGHFLKRLLQIRFQKDTACEIYICTYIICSYIQYIVRTYCINTEYNARAHVHMTYVHICYIVCRTWSHFLHFFSCASSYRIRICLERALVPILFKSFFEICCKKWFYGNIILILYLSIDCLNYKDESYSKISGETISSQTKFLEIALFSSLDSIDQPTNVRFYRSSNIRIREFENFQPG